MPFRNAINWNIYTSTSLSFQYLVLYHFNLLPIITVAKGHADVAKDMVMCMRIPLLYTGACRVERVKQVMGYLVCANIVMLPLMQHEMHQQYAHFAQKASMVYWKEELLKIWLAKTALLVVSLKLRDLKRVLSVQQAVIAIIQA